MDHVRTLIPPAARRWIYAVYILAGLIVGAVTVATGGLDWTAAAERVLAYLAVPLAVLAGVNVPTGGDWIDSQADGDDYGDLPVVLAEGGDGEPLDTTAPDGYETSEVSAAKTLVGDILGTDFGGYDNGDLDTLVAADRIINRLVAAGWRPTITDPYFASEELLREIDRQRE